MIDSGDVKNQAELARIKEISRARITQILNLLKLKPQIIHELEKLGDPLQERIISERRLDHISINHCNNIEQFSMYNYIPSE